MSFIDSAVICLQQDGVILVPTDTHYALAINPFSELACQRLEGLKDKDHLDQVSFCISHTDLLWPWVALSPWQEIQLKQLSAQYWPGPLKILLPKSQIAPNHSFMHDGSLAVVCNKNKLLNSIIDKLGCPLAVLPATQSDTGTGLVSMTTARDNFGSVVDMVVPTNNRNACILATTFVSLLDKRVKILRQGDILLNKNTFEN